MTIEIRCIADTHAAIGEGAVWDDREQCLWWVDIPAGRVFRTDPVPGETRSYDWGEPVGCLAVRDSGGLVLATKSGFWFFDPETGARTAIHDPEPHLPNNRFNDGTTDPSGRFWAGTMKDGGAPEPLGSLYRLDPDLTVTRWRGALYTSNGLAFAPDGARMYFSDSYPQVRRIWCCDYDAATGTPGAPDLYFDTASVAGRPDGATVDAEGHYWQAGVSGWQIYRISPQGAVVATIDMPVQKPFKPMFGGRNLDILFVTSIGAGLSDDARQPQAGGLFAITGLDVTGLPQTRFAG